MIKNVKSNKKFDWKIPDEWNMTIFEDETDIVILKIIFISCYSVKKKSFSIMN